MRGAWSLRCCTLAWALILCSAAIAHNGEPPPDHPELRLKAVPTAVVVRIYPPRWSWLHWWEANRSLYLEPLRQGSLQAPAPEVAAALRTRALTALDSAAASRNVETRVAAALALGRMGAIEKFATLQKLAKDDPSQNVRAVALLAIGMIDDAKAEALLDAYTPTSDQQLDAMFIALGQRPTLGPQSLDLIQKQLTGDIGSATVAVWALRAHPDPARTAILGRILDTTTNTWLASDALISLGQSGHPRAGGLLANVLLATEREPTIAAIAELRRRDKQLAVLIDDLQKQKLAYDQAYDKYLGDIAESQKTNPNIVPIAKATTVKKNIVVGLARIRESQLRASAAIALGNIQGRASSDALLGVLALDDDEYSDLYKGFAIMSLGQLGDERSLPVLLALLEPRRDNDTLKSKAQRESPLRGYAALALGLYCRPVRTPQGLMDRPDYAKASLALAKRLADAQETVEVRAAAALALGLTQRTETLKNLQPASETVNLGDELVAGYATLARGMLGDSTILTPAKKMLTLQDKTDTSGLLARRAAVLSLGVLGRQDGIPPLLDAWHHNYYVNRETITALSYCDALNVSDALLKMIEDPKQVSVHPFACICLGELLASERPSRLDTVVRGSNYTLKNTRLLPFQTLANDFLFTYLIPVFGEEWR